MPIRQSAEQVSGGRGSSGTVDGVAEQAAAERANGRAGESREPRGCRFRWRLEGLYREGKPTTPPNTPPTRPPSREVADGGDAAAEQAMMVMVKPSRRRWRKEMKLNGLD
ncbi:hypothetical protein Dimus_032487 [Dionaea muscipula]